VKWDVDKYSYDSPHIKTNLVLQAHFSSIKFWIPDFWTDLKSVLDQAVRILQAMVDVTADGGWLWTTLKTIELSQMVMQGQWSTDSTLKQLPCMTQKIIDMFARRGITCLPELLSIEANELKGVLAGIIPKKDKNLFWDVLVGLPIIDVKTHLGPVAAGQDCELTIHLNRVSKYPSKGAYTPKFPKQKEEGWWVILGDPTTGELMALRRVNCQGKSTAKLSFDIPEEKGSYCYYLYLMCDVYLGLDQQYEIKFEVTQAAEPKEDLKNEEPDVDEQ